MIFWAVTGPTPESASSCSIVAELRWTGPEAAPVPAPPLRGRCDGCAAPRHDDLLAVGDERSAVYELEVRLAGDPARTRQGVGDPRAVAQPIQARSAHGADDVHVDVPGRRFRGRRRRRPQGRRHGRPARTEQHAPDEHEHHDDSDGHEQETSAIDCEIRHVVNSDNELVTRV